MPSGKGTITELQALRGIAATVVVIGHTAGYYKLPNWFVRPSLIANGYASVTVFFVLSGFVLARSLLGQQPTVAGVTSFYIRRLFRLFPAIWAASALALVYILFLDKTIEVEGVSQWLRDRFNTNGLPMPVLIIGSFAAVLAFLVPPVWSIFVEIFGSTLMPLASNLLERHRVAFWTLTVLLFVVSVTVGRYTPHGVASYMIDFMVGAAIIAIPESAAERFAVSTYKYAVVTLSVLVLCLDRVIRPATERDPLSHMVELGAAWIIVASLVHGDFRARALRSKALIGLGDVSYSLYLIHFPAMCILAKALAVMGVQGGSLYRMLVLTVLTLASSFALAWLGYRYVELPGMRIGASAAKKWSRGWSAPPLTDPV